MGVLLVVVGGLLTSAGNLIDVVSLGRDKIVWCEGFLNVLGDNWLLLVGSFLRIVIDEFNVSARCAMIDFFEWHWRRRIRKENKQLDF